MDRAQKFGNRHARRICFSSFVLNIFYFSMNNARSHYESLICISLLTTRQYLTQKIKEKIVLKLTIIIEPSLVPLHFFRSYVNFVRKS